MWYIRRRLKDAHDEKRTFQIIERSEKDGDEQQLGNERDLGRCDRVIEGQQEWKDERNENEN